MKHLFRLVVLTFILCSTIYIQASNSYRKGSLFLSDREYQQIKKAFSNSQTVELFSAMQIRVNQRAMSLSLTDRTATSEWWHHASEYLTDAALVHAIAPSDKVGAWLHANVLSIVRRPVADWAGPPFRGYGGGDMVGGLETAHITWAIGISYDLASDLFNEDEKNEIKTALRTKGLLPCRRYLERSDFFHNWNCVLHAGYTVAAAVLQDKEALEYAASYLPIAIDHFQKDGSYGESLQYANYAAYAIMIAHEALLRSNTISKTTFDPYARMVDWSAYALFYRKPLSRWPIMDLPRSANFGDCAAVYRPSGDLLIHIATRAKTELPVQAGIARWLFDTLYFPANEPLPHDLASFGFVNDLGFLSVIMLAESASAVSPTEANYPTAKAFSGGDSFLRDKWNGSTTIAARMPAEPRHASAHLHGDINSFILVHNRERLLVDPGHTCYRNTTRDLDVSTSSHNTCTFEIPQTATSLAVKLMQRGGTNRPMEIVDGKRIGTKPISIGGKRLLVSRVNNVSVIGSDAAELYGKPLTKFNRFLILCGSNVLFVVDQIESEVPVSTTWSWLLNNRDGLLNYQFVRPHAIYATRGDAGLKIQHYGQGRMEGPSYALVHDAYHTLPGQFSEGIPGTGFQMRFKEQTPQTKRTVVHTMAMDGSGSVNGWESKNDNNTYILENKDRKEKWILQVADNGEIVISESLSNQKHKIAQDKKGVWSLSHEK